MPVVFAGTYQVDHWTWFEVRGDDPRKCVEQVAKAIPDWYRAIDVFQLRRQWNVETGAYSYSMAARWVEEKKCGCLSPGPDHGPTAS